MNKEREIGAYPRTHGDGVQKRKKKNTMKSLEKFANEASRRHMTYGQLQQLETLGRLDV